MDRPTYALPCAKVARRSARTSAQAFRLASGRQHLEHELRLAQLAGRRKRSTEGAALAGCCQGTGRGRRSPSTTATAATSSGRSATGYFGCRDEQGRFSLARFVDVVAATPTRPRDRGEAESGREARARRRSSPGAKVTQEIAALRGVPAGVDCISPAAHTAFHDADSLLDFVEQLAEASGLPVGIKTRGRRRHACSATSRGS